jgi:hypothetical protein
VVTAIGDDSELKILAPHGRVAGVSYAALNAIEVGESLQFTTPNAAGWYAVVTNFGASVDHPGKQVFQINVFSPLGLQASFTINH